MKLNQASLSLSHFLTFPHSHVRPTGGRPTVGTRGSAGFILARRALNKYFPGKRPVLEPPPDVAANLIRERHGHRVAGRADLETADVADLFQARLAVDHFDLEQVERLTVH